MNWQNNIPFAVAERYRFEENSKKCHVFLLCLDVHTHVGELQEPAIACQELEGKTVCIYFFIGSSESESFWEMYDDKAGTCDWL